MSGRLAGFRVCTLVYAFHRDALLLLRRRRPPNAGLWSPPGGHVRPGETPLASALRELREETGLAAGGGRLRLVVSEADEVRREAWLMFGFVVRLEATGGPGGSGRPRPVGGEEGQPAWFDLEQVRALALPPADRRLLAAVVDGRSGVAFARVRFRDGRLEGVEVDWG